MDTVLPDRRCGVDVGGTKCLGVVIDPYGRIVDEVRHPTPHEGGGLLDVLGAIGDELRPWDTFGVGIPALVRNDGVMVASAHLGRMAGLDLRGGLAERGIVDAAIANDATCATLAEWTVGAGRGTTDMVMVTLGTGIGGGIIAGGNLVTGRNGFAGEFGHMPVDPDGPECPCGRRGCWERYASGTGLARLAAEAVAAAPDEAAASAIEATHGDPGVVSGEQVQQAARCGDAFALAVIDEFARWVATGLVGLTNALDPQRFVLGGGLATGADLYLEPIRHWFAELLYASDQRPDPEIRFAELGEHAGAIGAASLAHRVGRVRAPARGRAGQAGSR